MKIARRSPPVSLFLSLGELAWIGAFFVMVAFLSQVELSNIRTAELEKLLKERDQEAERLATSLHRQETAYAKLHAANEELERKRETTRELLASKEKQSQADQRELAKCRSQKRDLEEKYDDLAHRFTQIQSELEDAGRQLADQRRIRAELLGLNGQLDRVVLVIDCSASMGRDGKWSLTRRIIQEWAAFLEMRECALVAFSGRAVVVRDGTNAFINLQGPEGRRNRLRVIDYLQRVTPNGGTNTLDALEKAYALFLNAKEAEHVPEKVLPGTIILFTDGAPNDGSTAEFDPVSAEQIYRLCKMHPEVKVNTVGLGEYFDQDLGVFLRKVAELTGGGFIGR